MEMHTFKKSAKFIARRNISDRVEKVAVSFDASDSRLRVIFLINGVPNDNDAEDCEIACAELIAEFPEIKSAETACVSMKERFDFDADAIVFSKL